VFESFPGFAVVLFISHCAYLFLGSERIKSISPLQPLIFIDKRDLNIRQQPMADVSKGFI